MTIPWEQRDELNRQLFRNAIMVYNLRDLMWDSARNIGAARGQAAAEEVVELRIHRPYWMEEAPKVVTGKWLSVTPIKEHDDLGWWVAVLRFDVREAPADTAVAPPAADCNNIAWDQFRDAVSGRIGYYESLSSYNRVSERVVLFVPLQDDPDTHVPAVISDYDLDNEGWKTRVRIEAELIEDVDRQVKRFGPPNFGW